MRSSPAPRSMLCAHATIYNQAVTFVTPQCLCRPVSNTWPRPGAWRAGFDASEHEAKPFQPICTLTFARKGMDRVELTKRQRALSHSRPRHSQRTASQPTGTGGACMESPQKRCGVGTAGAGVRRGAEGVGDYTGHRTTLRCIAGPAVTILLSRTLSGATAARRQPACRRNPAARR